MAGLPLNYQIETERCRLRIPLETDIPWIFDASREPGFCDGMAWEPPARLEELMEPFRQTIEAWKTGQSYSFTIERKSDDALLGRIGIRRTSEPDAWSIGYWLHREHRRQGLMTESAKAILQLGFETLNANSIEACYVVSNMQSERVLSEIGMTFSEYLPQGLKKGDRWLPENKMISLRSSWLKCSLK